MFFFNQCFSFSDHAARHPHPHEGNEPDIEPQETAYQGPILLSKYRRLRTNALISSKYLENRRFGAMDEITIIHEIPLPSLLIGKPSFTDFRMICLPLGEHYKSDKKSTLFK